MKTFLISSLALVLTCTPLPADEQVRRVQEELRKRNLYFGDIDGRKSKEISGAIRRYQQRKGFAATGELDIDTLRSLKLAPPLTIPPAETWPDVTVLKSDVAREITEADRKMLEAEASKEVPDPAPVAEPPATEPPVSEPPAATPPVAEPPVAEPPVAEPPVAEPPVVEIAPPQPVVSPEKKVAERAEAFVREYLDVAETNKLEAEMAFYADRVAYFDHGTVGREFIERDVRKYYKRWPQRDYDLIDFKVSKVAGNDVEVRFKINFRVRNAEHSVAGKTNNIFKIRRAGDDMRFVALKEQRLRK